LKRNTSTNYRPNLSIIIPTLNEEEGIKKTVDCIPRSIKECSEILVVDGRSEDQTVYEAEQAGCKVIVVDRLGKGFAMREGARQAKGRVLVFIDGDGTYPAEDIPKFLETVEQNVMVIGNALPFIRSQKNLLERVRFLYPSFLHTKHVFYKNGIRLQDPLNGMRAITKEDFHRLNLASDGFEIETEMDLKAVSLGMKTVEIPINMERRKGKSKFLFNFKSHLRILSLLRNKDAIITMLEEID
jgi:dolichol-phosphate hexosyltransferase